MGLLCGEGCVILTSTVFHWSTRVTDGRTDRQTDGRWHIARYSMYAVARSKSWHIVWRSLFFRILRGHLPNIYSLIRKWMQQTDRTTNTAYTIKDKKQRINRKWTSHTAENKSRKPLSQNSLLVNIERLSSVNVPSLSTLSQKSETVALFCDSVDRL